MTISILISISIFFKSVDISTIDMSYRYIEQGYSGWEHVKRKMHPWMSTMKGGRKDFDTPFWSWDTWLSGACWPKWPRENLSPPKITFSGRNIFFRGFRRGESGRIQATSSPMHIISENIFVFGLAGCCFDKKTERQKDRKTERQKDRKTERQKEKEIGI